MASVLVPLAMGFEEIEVVSIIDVLRRGGVEVVSASLDDRRNVLGANGITIVANNELKNIKSEDFDMIVLPGGIPGAEHLRDNDKVQELLKEFDNSSKPIGAICAAPIALDKAGLIKGDYTCYPSYEEGIKSGNFRDTDKVVISDRIMTSRGPGTAICFALSIVKQLVGNETYEALKDGLLADYC